MNRNVVACICLQVFVCLAVRAEETNDIVYVALEDERPTVRTNELISVRFTNTPLAKVVQYFAERQRLNVICVMDGLTNRVTANLNKVNDKPALESILEACGFWLTEKIPGSGIHSVSKIRKEREPVYLPFEVVVEAKPNIYYEIYVHTLHQSRAQLVTSGKTGREGIATHQLSALDDFSVYLTVEAAGHKKWEQRVILLRGGNPEQTFRAILEREKKK